MFVFNILERVFNIVFILSIVFTLIDYVIKWFSNSCKEFKRKSDSSKVYIDNDSNDKIQMMTTIVSLIVFILIVFGVCFEIKRLMWLFIIIIIPTYMEKVVIAYQSIGMVKDIIQSSDRRKLSLKERTSIYLLAYGVWFLGAFNVWEKLVEKIYVFDNTYISDIGIALIYILIFSIYIFFICGLFPDLIVYTITMLRWINKKLFCSEKMKKHGDNWINRIEKSISYKSIFEMHWKYIKQIKSRVRYIMYILLPASFVADVIIMLIKVFISMIESAVGYTYVLGRMIKITMGRLADRLVELTNKRMIAICFRIAIILALVCTVVINRYQPIFRNEEATTAILEFVASAIIIPIVFDWISSIRKK